VTNTRGPVVSSGSSECVTVVSGQCSIDVLRVRTCIGGKSLQHTGT